jgi:hypothetical protein
MMTPGWSNCLSVYGLQIVRLLLRREKTSEKRLSLLRYTFYLAVRETVTDSKDVMTEDTTQKAGKPLAGILGIVLIAAGLLLGWFSLNEFRVHERMKSWPATPGLVVSSSVVGERAFRPQIVYQYDVGGLTFTDTTFLDMPSFGGRNSRREAADTMAAEYPVGKTVTVHYDPESPALSHLKVGAPWSVFGKMGLAGVLVILGLVIELILIRMRRR